MKHTYDHITFATECQTSRCYKWQMADTEDLVYGNIKRH